ncbi:sigma-70 family RNA polymerase sigma factor [Thermocatellispora tengchongensis]
MAETFRRHVPLLYSVAYGMLGDRQEADGVVQEARARWLAAAERNVAQPPVGLTALVTVLALARLRAARSDGEAHIGPWLPEPLRNESELSLAESVSAALAAVLDALKHEERTVFLLHHGFGMSYADIAALIGTSEPSVRRIDARAEARVRCEPRPPDGDGARS